MVRQPLVAKSTPAEPSGPDGEKSTGLDDAAGGGRFRRIRCPKCQWRPSSESRWGCRCGVTWNTFDTAGQCPGCRHVWTWTACLSCTQWSPHEDWYEKETPKN